MWNSEMGKEVTFCDTCNVFFISEDFRFHHLSKRHVEKAVQCIRPECSLYIEKFPPETEAENIFDYFCYFGAVKAVAVQRRRDSRAILEFYNKNSVIAVLNSKEFPVLNGVSVVVRSYYPECNEERSLESPMPYHLLMENLRYYGTVENQMMFLSSSLLLSEEQFNMRMDLLDLLRRRLSTFFPECSLHLFGSSLNGYGIKGCDVDILFEASPVMPVEPPGDRLKRKQIFSMSPLIREVKNRTFSLDSLLRLPRVVQLHFIMRILRSYINDFHSVTFVNAQVCPIVKLVSKAYGLSCDISNGNRLSVYNSLLLSFYGKLDPRVVPLMTVIRYWGKKFGYINTRNFSSYSFSLLVIFFLQTRIPAVLPSVNFLRSKADSQTIEDGFDCSFCSDVQRTGHSKNRQSLESLLMEFFEYYGNFDFVKFAIVPFLGHCELKSSMCESKSEKKKVSAVYVQDPFCVSRNVASSVKEKQLCNMKHHFQRIAKEYHDHLQKMTGEFQKAKSHSTSESVFWGIPQVFNVIPEFIISLAASTQLSRSIEIELNAAMVNSVQKKYGIKCTHCVNMKEICIPVVVNAVIELMSCGLLFTLTVHDTLKYIELLRKRKSLRINCSCEASMECVDSKGGTLTNLNSKPPNFTKQTPFLTVEVTAPYRTWRNREQYNAVCVRGDMCPLEYERCISQKITTLAKSRMEKAAELRCEFYEFNQNADSLLIKVAPGKNRSCWQQIGKFLASYLPKLIKDIL